MGLYTAVAAFAGLGGAVLGGLVAANTGCATTLWLAVATLIAGLVLTSSCGQRASPRRPAVPRPRRPWRLKRPRPTRDHAEVARPLAATWSRDGCEAGRAAKRIRSAGEARSRTTHGLSACSRDHVDFTWA